MIWSTTKRCWTRDAPLITISTAALLLLLAQEAQTGPLTHHLSVDGDNDVSNSSVSIAPIPVIHHNCRYQGSVYNYGEEVPTDEPCLHCQCKSAVVCKLRVCEEMPVPPPPGCIVVHKARKCCAQLVCSPHGPDAKHKNHRENRLASTIDESLTAASNNSKGSCILDGTVYAEGSAMQTSSLCEYCFCIRGQMKCSSPACIIPAKGCKPRFRSYACCPTNYDCQESNATAILKTIPTTSPVPDFLKGCMVKGRRIADGEPVLPLEIGNHTDPCQTCFCMGGTVRCRPLECDRPIQGCRPIKEDGHCCPDRYECGPVHDSALSTTIVPESTDSPYQESVTTLKSLSDESNALNGFKSAEGTNREATTAVFDEDISTTSVRSEASIVDILPRTASNVAAKSQEKIESRAPSDERDSIYTFLGQLWDAVGNRVDRRNKDETDFVEPFQSLLNVTMEGVVVPTEGHEIVEARTEAPDAEEMLTFPPATEYDIVPETTTSNQPELTSTQAAVSTSSVPAPAENASVSIQTTTVTQSVESVTASVHSLLTGSNDLIRMTSEVNQKRVPSIPLALIDYKGIGQQFEGDKENDDSKKTSFPSSPALPLDQAHPLYYYDQNIPDSKPFSSKKAQEDTTTMRNFQFISFGLEDAVPSPRESSFSSYLVPGEPQAAYVGPAYDNHALRISLIQPSRPRGYQQSRPSPRGGSGNSQGRESKIAVMTSDDFRNAIMDVPVSTSLYNNGYYRNGIIIEDDYDRFPLELEINSSLPYPGLVFNEHLQPSAQTQMPTSPTTTAPTKTTTTAGSKLESDHHPSRTYSKFKVHDSPLHRIAQQTIRTTRPPPKDPLPYIGSVEVIDHHNNRFVVDSAEPEQGKKFHQNKSPEDDMVPGSAQLSRENKSGGDQEYYEHSEEEEEQPEDDEEEEEEPEQTQEQQSNESGNTHYNYKPEGHFRKTTTPIPVTIPPTYPSFTSTPITKLVFPQKNPLLNKPHQKPSNGVPSTHQISRIGAFGGYQKNKVNPLANFKPAVVMPFPLPKVSTGHSGGLSLGLKLSGCNIYGKMYNVDDIIKELSSNCVRCKCTDVGVQCAEAQC